MKQIVTACFNQPAAKTAKQFVIPVVRKDLWEKELLQMLLLLNPNTKNLKLKIEKTKGAVSYYQKILPKIYGAG